jgi:hypothetical protein
LFCPSADLSRWINHPRVQTQQVPPEWGSTPEDRSARLSVDPASLDHARAMFIDGQFTGENDEHLDPSMLGIAGRPLVNLRYFPRLTVGQRGKPAVNEHVMSIMKNAKITDA